MPFDRKTPSDKMMLRTISTSTMPGWMQDISACRPWEEIPANARKFVKRMSCLTGCPATTVSVGSDCEQTIPVE